MLDDRLYFNLTYEARRQAANVNPIISDASPVFDFVSIATIIITVTRTNVTMNSIKTPF